MSTKLVWLDIETTGLDPEKDLILAIGVRITDENLNSLAEDREWTVYWSTSTLLSLQIHPNVVKMHTFNGIWSRVTNPECSMLLTEIQISLSAFLNANLGSEQGILAGNSVHFDREFLRYNFGKEFLDQFSHRLLDMSFFKVFAPIIKAPMPPVGEISHTPLKDLDASMAQYRYWKDKLGAAIGQGYWKEDGMVIPAGTPLRTT